MQIKIGGRLGLEGFAERLEAQALEEPYRRFEVLAVGRYPAEPQGARERLDDAARFLMAHPDARTRQVYAIQNHPDPREITVVVEPLPLRTVADLAALGLPRPAALEIVFQVGDLLATLNGQSGFRHRSLSAAAIALGNGGLPVLLQTDGGAWVAEHRSGATELGHVSPGNQCAPEQVDPRRFGPAGPATDVYLLAWTALELLSGVERVASWGGALPGYDAESHAELVQGLLGRLFLSESDFSLARWIAEALRWDPSTRPTMRGWTDEALTYGASPEALTRLVQESPQGEEAQPELSEWTNEILILQHPPSLPRNLSIVERARAQRRALPGGTPIRPPSGQSSSSPSAFFSPPPPSVDPALRETTIMPERIGMVPRLGDPIPLDLPPVPLDHQPASPLSPFPFSQPPGPRRLAQETGWIPALVVSSPPQSSPSPPAAPATMPFGGKQAAPSGTEFRSALEVDQRGSVRGVLVLIGLMLVVAVIAGIVLTGR